MSIITLVTFTLILLVDFASPNAFLGRAPFQVGWLCVLSVFWLAANAFSTSRWRHVPLQCDAIPADFDSEKAWCKDLQALKSFVWVEWVAREYPPRLPSPPPPFTFSAPLSDDDRSVP